MKPLKYIDYQRVKWEGARRLDAPEDEPGFEAVGRILEPGGDAVSYGGRYRGPAVSRPLQYYGAPPALGSWADRIADDPVNYLSPEQKALIATWPTTAKTYRIAELIPFVTALLVELGRVQSKIAPIVGRTSFLVWGPSDEFLTKVEDINMALSRIAIRMGKRAKFAKFDAAKKGFDVVTFPDLRKDAIEMMALTRSLDRLAVFEGGPTWIGSSTLAIVEAFTRTGAWMVETGAKVAKPVLALLSNIDLIIWGALGVLGLMWWQKRSKG